jgi:bacterioferritin-associated ferredoxin
MSPDDEVCLCFHVTRRKLVSFIRVRQPQRATQLSECESAGTGCGWCRPFLERIFRQAQTATGESNAGLGEGGSEIRPDLPAESELTPNEYARLRAAYRKQKETTPDQDR